MIYQNFPIQIRIYVCTRADICIRDWFGICVRTYVVRFVVFVFVLVLVLVLTFMFVFVFVCLNRSVCFRVGLYAGTNASVPC